MKKLLVFLILLTSCSVYGMDNQDDILGRPKALAQLIALHGGHVNMFREDFMTKFDSIFQIMIAPDIVMNPFLVAD